MNQTWPHAAVAPELADDTGAALSRGAGLEDLLRRASRARDLVIAKLIARRTPEGRWVDPKDVYAFSGAVHIFTLRTTGLIDRSGAAQEEAALVRHMIRQVNPDGGFFKFPTSPSSKTLTRAVVLALRLATGEVAPGRRPVAWFRRNEHIDDELGREVAAAIYRAEGFLRTSTTKTTGAFEVDHVIFERIFRAHVNETAATSVLAAIAMPVGEMMASAALPARVQAGFNYLVRKLVPGLWILYRRGCERNARTRPIGRLLLRIPARRRRLEASVQAAAARIRREQNENGGWFYNTIYTAVNLMALVEAGAALSDAAILRAHDYLRAHLFTSDDGGCYVNIMDSDLMDTSAAVYVYLGAPGHAAGDGAIRPSLETLLASQAECGGFAWGTGSSKDTDTDSTATALAALASARRSAQGALEARLVAALERGLAYLRTHQGRRGGYGVWDTTPLAAPPGSLGYVRQALFDVASADVTSRVLVALAEMGLKLQDGMIRRSLGFLADTQCRNGAWWSRWWAGYVSGTDFVLAGLGRLGFRRGPNPFRDDRLLAATHDAMMRGAAFLLRCQNGDGGWGESVNSDRDGSVAGNGPSSVMHTAATVSALLACDFSRNHPAVRRGVEYVLSTAQADGTWNDQQVAFTFFARTFYYRYPFWNHVLPALALNRFCAPPGQASRPGPDRSAKT